MNIFVGNLSYSSTEEGIRALFEAYGEVASAKIINNRETGRSRGFAFVEMPNDAEGKAAIEGLNGRDLDGRALRVSEAQGRAERDNNRGERTDRGDRGDRGDRNDRGDRGDRPPKAGYRPERFRIDGNFRRDRG
jgi:RNA recognition motif-containing protein